MFPWHICQDVRTPDFMHEFDCGSSSRKLLLLPSNASNVPSDTEKLVFRAVLNDLQGLYWTYTEEHDRDHDHAVVVLCSRFQAI